MKLSHRCVRQPTRDPLVFSSDGASLPLLPCYIYAMEMYPVSVADHWLKVTDAEVKLPKLPTHHACRDCSVSSGEGITFDRAFVLKAQSCISACRDTFWRVR